jgi:hypothetical protein
MLDEINAHTLFLQSFLITAVDGVGSQLHIPASLPPSKALPLFIEYEAV